MRGKRRSQRGTGLGRERTFWDEHTPSLDACLREYKDGPEPNTRAMLDAVGAVEGRRVLDFACGAGVTTAWLAARGAVVTGIDLSPRAAARAREVLHALDLDATIVVGQLSPGVFADESFDAIVGRYALHHVELAAVAPLLRQALVPGGLGAFLETMALNPLLRIARERLTGRMGVARYGSDDEHPLTDRDLRFLKDVFGEVSTVVEELRFLRVFDRNVLRYRHRSLSQLAQSIDDTLLRLGLGRLSYHQVVVVRRSS